MDVVIRLLAAGFGLYALVRGGLRLRQLWPVETSELRLIVLAVLVFCAASVHGSLEAIAMSVPLGPRSFSNAFACVVAALAFSLPKRYHTGA